MPEIDIQKQARVADLHLRVSPAELALIQEGAAAHERLVSDWARRVLVAEASKIRGRTAFNGRTGGRPKGVAKP